MTEANVILSVCTLLQCTEFDLYHHTRTKQIVNN